MVNRTSKSNGQVKSYSHSKLNYQRNYGEKSYAWECLPPCQAPSAGQEFPTPNTKLGWPRGGLQHYRQTPFDSQFHIHPSFYPLALPFSLLLACLQLVPFSVDMGCRGDLDFSLPWVPFSEVLGCLGDTKVAITLGFWLSHMHPKQVKISEKQA